uniref:Uncharacterized protein n=1 Tax=Anguilla anguilla TaxID=7936 RepID=A0A0E9VTC2_ANGAN
MKQDTCTIYNNNQNN